MNNQHQPSPSDKNPTTPMSSSSADDLLRSRMMAPPSSPGILGMIDRFEVQKQLGQGGMGQVLLAREPVTGGEVAIKMIRIGYIDDEQMVHRFLTEARHMYRMSHPNILKVMEVSDREEGPYFVMPYVAGGSLAQQTKHGEPLAQERILPIARQIAEALIFAHSKGIIHRDLKAANVLVENDGRAYLSDFGLVRTVFNDSIVDVEKSQVEGTVAYMSPGVADGKAEDTRCDIYSFGAMLYEMLTGQPPYEPGPVMAMLRKVANEPPPPIGQLNPDAPAGLIDIAEGCMARELRNRYAEMSDVLADLDRAAAGETPLGPHGHAEANGKTKFRRVAALACAAAAVLSLIAAGLWVATRPRGTDRSSRAPAGTADALVQGAASAPDPGPSGVPGAALRPHPASGEGLATSDARLAKVAAPWRATLDQANNAYNENRFEEALQLYNTTLAAIKVDDSTDSAVLYTFREPAERRRDLCRFFLQRDKMKPSAQVEATQRKLAELNPGYEGTGTFTIEDGRIVAAELSSPEIMDLSPLKGLPLKELRFHKVQDVRSLEPLRGMPLTKLQVSCKHELSDISPLKGMPLTYLDIWNSVNVTDLSSLAGMPLEFLNCARTSVEDLSPLGGMPLTELNCAATLVSDFSPLAGMQLKTIQLTPGYRPKKGWHALRQMDSLESINHMPPAEFWKKLDAGEFQIEALHEALKAENPEYTGNGDFGVTNG